MQRQKGNFELITGCMFTEKSLDLLDYIQKYDEKQEQVLCFSTVSDFIFSRATDFKWPAIKIDKNNPMVIVEHVKKEQEVNHILIDEIQFLSTEVLKVINTLIDEGINIIGAGLNQDFRGIPFPVMKDLMPHADMIQVKYTKCICCDKKATKTQRLLNGKPAPLDGPLVLLDNSKDEYTYQPRCKTCFQKNII